MAGGKHVLFYLDEEGKHRLGCDDLQWILERGNPKSARPGKDSGYRGISFVCTRKEILYDVIGEKCVDLSIAASELLTALPDDFLEFRGLLDRLGIEAFRALLEGRAGARRGGRDTPRCHERLRLRRERSTRRSDPRRRSLEAVRDFGKSAS